MPGPGGTVRMRFKGIWHPAVTTQDLAASLPHWFGTNFPWRAKQFATTNSKFNIANLA